jgi:hypothetical protein
MSHRRHWNEKRDGPEELDRSMTIVDLEALVSYEPYL